MDDHRRQIVKSLAHHLRKCGLDVQLNRKQLRVFSRGTRQSDLCLGKSRYMSGEWIEERQD